MPMLLAQETLVMATEELVCHSCWLFFPPNLGKVERKLFTWKQKLLVKFILMLEDGDIISCNITFSVVKMQMFA